MIVDGRALQQPGFKRRHQVCQRCGQRIAFTGGFRAPQSCFCRLQNADQLGVGKSCTQRFAQPEGRIHEVGIDLVAIGQRFVKIERHVSKVIDLCERGGIHRKL